MTWTCICGKVHLVNGQTIICSGPGHFIELRPAWFEMNKKTSEKPIIKKDQYALF